MTSITLTRANDGVFEGTWSTMLEHLAADLLTVGEIEVTVEVTVDSTHRQRITGMWTNLRLAGTAEYPQTHLVIATPYGLLLINVDEIMQLSF